MRILIVTNHFWPENFRINDLAVGLKEGGHEITVLTGIPNYPEGKFYPGYGFSRRRVEDYRGIRVVRFPLIPRGKGKSWNLILNYLSSALMACLLAPFYCRERFDLIFVFETSPVTIGLPAIVVKKFQSIPIIFWVLDLWPESLAATGAVRSPRVLSLVKRLVRFIYRRCDKILVSSRGFSESIKAVGGYEGAIEYFPNWVEPDYLAQAKEDVAASLPDLPKGFRVVFAGNIGAAQDFETILKAAAALVTYPDIHWIILGDGRRAAWVREQVKARHLSSRVHLLGRFPSEMMPAFFARADALLITLKREPIFALTTPGKLQSYMAAGKPIIAVLDGEGAKLIEESGAGFAIQAENPGALAEKVIMLYRMAPEDRREMGARGRAYCSQHFDRDKAFAKLTALMRNVGQRRRK